MEKRIKKVLKQSWLLFFCISSILLMACEEQPDIYLASYVSSESSEMPEVLDTDIEKVSEVYVYVCGAVMNPDVYVLPEGSRICDAIALAGGLREDADEMSVNQAQPVSDGQMIRIYTKEEVSVGLKNGEGMSESQSADRDVSLSETDDRININTATSSQLMMLPGIGSAKADAIIDYRTKQGSFDRIEDLMKIPGIKAGIFEQIKERIKID